MQESLLRLRLNSNHFPLRPVMHATFPSPLSPHHSSFVIRHCAFAITALLATLASPSTRADDNSTESDPRYGLFNWLNHRSQYGLGVFPEPFLIDDSDLEVNELRLDWWRENSSGQLRTDVIRAELEKGIGNLTIELEIPFEIATQPGQTTHGFDNLSIGGRYPLFQSVSAGGTVDNTVGIALEMGIPMHTAFSKNPELVPKIFDDLKVGDFTLQAVLGYSMLYGPAPDGGLRTFEYGFVFGYAFQKPCREIQQLVPVFELHGERELNRDSGHNNLTGNIALRVNLKAIERIQPRFGIGYLFPMDQGARADFHGGMFTSLIFEF